MSAPDEFEDAAQRALRGLEVVAAIALAVILLGMAAGAALWLSVARAASAVIP